MFELKILLGSDSAWLPGVNSRPELRILLGSDSAWPPPLGVGEITGGALDSVAAGTGEGIVAGWEGPFRGALGAGPMTDPRKMVGFAALGLGRSPKGTAPSRTARCFESAFEAGISSQVRGRVSGIGGGSDSSLPVSFSPKREICSPANSVP